MEEIAEIQSEIKQAKEENDGEEDAALESELVRLQLKNNEFEQSPLQTFNLINAMSTSKRDAWLNIYNDFLQVQQESEQPSQERGDQEEDRLFENQSALDKVNTKEDFFELFRDWQIKETVPEKYVGMKSLAQAEWHDPKDQTLLKQHTPIDLGQITSEFN